jgi:hypothetical protein
MIIDMADIMSVMPVQKFLHDEETQNSGQDKNANQSFTFNGLKRFREQMKKNVAQQGSDSNADQDEYHFPELVGSEGQKKYTGNGNDADYDGTGDRADPDVGHEFSDY